MFKNIFLKSVYERRWAMLWWGLGMFATTLLIVLLFPTFSEAFGQSLKDVPDSLKQIIGNAADYQQIEGFLQLQVFMQMIFLTIIYGVILCSGLIAGEEGQGTLQALLSQPVSRSKVYWHKLAASAVVLWVVNSMLFVGVVAGCLIIGESANFGRVFLSTAMMWLVSMVFSLFAYTLGAATGRRGFAGAIAGVYIFVAYLVSSLVSSVEWLKYINYASPLKYFGEPRIMDSGLDAGNVAILVIACGVLSVVGWIMFTKRDVYAR